MTEQEWLVSTDPARMLAFHTTERSGAVIKPQFRISDRKLRLLACACARQVVLVDSRSQQAVEVAEQYADGEATKEELTQASLVVQEVGDLDWAAFPAVADGLRVSILQAFEAVWNHPVRANELPPLSVQAALLRTIVGNPWWPVSLCGNRDHGSVVVRPYCPACRQILDHADGRVPKLASVIYDERRWTDMPMLADALEESGCRDEEMLDHCRGTDLVKVCPWCVDSLPDPETNAIECSRCDGIGIIPSAREPIFVRGDWVIDILTGKE